MANIKSDIQLQIWESFRGHGVAFPFPQQDLHLKTAPEIAVGVNGGQDAAEGFKIIAPAQ